LGTFDARQVVVKPPLWWAWCSLLVPSLAVVAFAPLDGFGVILWLSFGLGTQLLVLVACCSRVVVSRDRLATRGLLLWRSISLTGLVSVVTRLNNQGNWRLVLADAHGRIPLPLNGFRARDRQRLLEALRPYVEGRFMTEPVERAFTNTVWWPRPK
jgi:hypothetical protein